LNYLSLILSPGQDRAYSRFVFLLLSSPRVSKHFSRQCSTSPHSSFRCSWRRGQSRRQTRAHLKWIFCSRENDSCGASQIFAFSVTSVQDVPFPSKFQGQTSCAVLGPTPTNAGPCAITVNPVPSSSVSAVLSYAACVATHFSCPSPTPTSAAFRTVHDTGVVAIWSAIVVLSLMLVQ
jgi:hypothetical protein